MPQPFNGYAQAAPAKEEDELARVGFGTPCGELMRRFWQPIALTVEVTDGKPHAVRILGEDLVLFKDRSGQIGLLHAQCSHRRASLEFGVVSERGIRCCYHGWLFDADGTILETPGEPADSPIRHTVTHGAYPTRDYKGIIFAYLGPADAMPEFPIFDTFEQPGTDMVPYAYEYPCNWLQTAENVVDPFHTVFLHTRVSGTQFSDAFGEMPVVVWKDMPSGAGIYLFNVRRVGDHLWIRTQESFRPNFSQTGDIWQDPKTEKVFSRVGLSKWIVPLDDTNCRVIGWRYFSDELDLSRKGDRAQVGKGMIDFPGQTASRDYETKQLQPGDFEAIVSQGPINIHAKENLGATDLGVGMYRQRLRRAIRQLQKGEPLPMPVRNGDGLYASYTQDTVLRIPLDPTDDVAFRCSIAERVIAIVFETDPLPRATRRGAIRDKILERLGPTYPTIGLGNMPRGQISEGAE